MTAAAAAMVGGAEDGCVLACGVGWHRPADSLLCTFLHPTASPCHKEGHRKAHPRAHAPSRLAPLMGRLTRLMTPVWGAGGENRGGEGRTEAAGDL